MVKAVPVSGFAGTRKQIDKLCADAEVLSGNKAYWVRVDGSGELVGGIAKFLAPMKDALISALGLAPTRSWPSPRAKMAAAQKTAGALIKLLGALCPEHMDAEHVRLLLDSGLPHVRDRRGGARDGVLPQPLLHAQGRA